MSNSELMKFLSEINKNDTQKKQIIVFGIVAIISMAGCCILYSKHKDSDMICKGLKAENDFYKVQLFVQNDQIRRQKNTINQLVYEKEIKAEKNTPPISPLTEETNNSL